MDPVISEDKRRSRLGRLLDATRRKVVEHPKTTAAGLALGSLKVFGGHKLLEAGLSNLVRKSGIAENYYSNAAREGMQAALTGKDVLPTTRRAFGAISPTLSGLADYEVSRGLVKKLLSVLKKYQPDVVKKITSVEDLRKVISKNKHLLGGVHGFDLINDNVLENMRSPLSRHIHQAIANDKLKKNRLIEWMKARGLGKGAEKGSLPYTVPAGILGGVGALMHGPAGFLGNVLASPALEAGIGKAMNPSKSSYNNIMELKWGLTGDGVLTGMDRARDNSLLTKLKSFGLSLAQPATAEIYDLGRDAGKSIRYAANTGNMILNNSSKGKLVQGAGIGAMQADLIQHAQNAIKNKVNDNMVAPARNNAVGRFMLRKPIPAPNAPPAIMNLIDQAKNLSPENLKELGSSKDARKQFLAGLTGN